MIRRCGRGGILLVLLGVGLAGICLVSPVGGNLWMLATCRGFQIPAESTLFTFRVTRPNEGSGEWWQYAEDANYCYSQGDRPGVSYVAIPRAKAATVPGFLPADITTWPKDLTIAHPVAP